MSPEKPSPIRFIGLDIHKHCLIAMGVDEGLNPVLGPQRVQLVNLEGWIRKTLTPSDEVVIEMTTNTWQAYDELLPHVHSVTVVHPPYVALITRSQVMTDKIAATNLARLHAKGLLVGVWVPPQEVRDRRALSAQRRKMSRLATQAKNRLHAPCIAIICCRPKASSSRQTNETGGCPCPSPRWKRRCCKPTWKPWISLKLRSPAWSRPCSAWQPRMTAFPS
jgi:transposase